MHIFQFIESSEIDVIICHTTAPQLADYISPEWSMPRGTILCFAGFRNFKYIFDIIMYQGQRSKFIYFSLFSVYQCLIRSCSHPLPEFNEVCVLKTIGAVRYPATFMD